MRGSDAFPAWTRPKAEGASSQLPILQAESGQGRSLQPALPPTGTGQDASWPGLAVGPSVGRLSSPFTRVDVLFIRVE